MPTESRIPTLAAAAASSAVVALSAFAQASTARPVKDIDPGGSSTPGGDRLHFAASGEKSGYGVRRGRQGP